MVMKKRLTISTNCQIRLFLILAILLFRPAALSAAWSAKDLAAFQRQIVDYRPRLNPKYKKVKRRQTKYIIVHTSELGLKTTLRVVSKGKWVNKGRRKTHGGHANYVVARNGRTYRMLDKGYIADHAGRSMWDGETNISRVSIGIEMVGYHYAPLTSAQYRSVGKLIRILQGVYGLDDLDVLTHSQIAYGRPNRWFKKNHRGRKRCAKNFIRSKAGLGPTWPYDPDVRAGRLTPDAELASLFYGKKRLAAKLDEANIISITNTAWAIAGEDFDSPSTVYKYPDGTITTGREIANSNGWSRLPVKTVVLLNQGEQIDKLRKEGPVKTISDGITAWALAGRAYNRETTFYFLPSGRVLKGSKIDDWDDLPCGTNLIVGYDGPHELSKNRSAYSIAGKKYKASETIYYLPNEKPVGGDEIRDFSRLHSGIMVFIPKK